MQQAVGQGIAGVEWDEVQQAIYTVFQPFLAGGQHHQTTLPITFVQQNQSRARHLHVAQLRLDQTVKAFFFRSRFFVIDLFDNIVFRFGLFACFFTVFGNGRFFFGQNGRVDNQADARIGQQLCDIFGLIVQAQVENRVTLAFWRGQPQLFTGGTQAGLQADNVVERLGAKLRTAHVYQIDIVSKEVGEIGHGVVSLNGRS